MTNLATCLVSSNERPCLIKTWWMALDRQMRLSYSLHMHACAQELSHTHTHTHIQHKHTHTQIHLPMIPVFKLILNLNRKKMFICLKTGMFALHSKSPTHWWVLVEGEHRRIGRRWCNCSHEASFAFNS